MKHPLLGIFLLAIVLTASFRAPAAQSAPLTGVHELPVFVVERIELTPGTVGDGTPLSEQYPEGLGSRDVERAQPVSGRN
jgi:hypothetical protein